MCVLFLKRNIMEDHQQNLTEDGTSQDEHPKKSKKQRRREDRHLKHKKNPPQWLIWGLGVLFLSFGLTVVFSFLAELIIDENSPAILCVIVLLVLLILNISCDVLANAIIACKPEAFHAMASNRIRGARRAVAFCRNASKLGSIFADVIGDICGIVSGAAGTVLAAIIALSGDGLVKLISSILVSAVIGALTVGGKAIFKHFAIKYSKKIVFAFAKFTTFFIKEKKRK